MAISDQYMTLAEPTTGLYKEKGSKFVSYACPISSVSDAMNQVEKIKKEHHKARHHCFAYRLGTDGQVFRANDDGEPSGTAGRPILGQIDSLGLSDVLVVVSRYFGGKLLGAAGLAQAYRHSAANALEAGAPVLKRLRAYFQVDFKYEIMGTLMQSLSRHGAEVLSQELCETPSLVFSLPLSYKESDLDKIMASTLNLYPGEINGKRTMKHLSVRHLPGSAGNATN